MIDQKELTKAVKAYQVELAAARAEVERYEKAVADAEAKKAAGGVVKGGRMGRNDRTGKTRVDLQNKLAEATARADAGFTSFIATQDDLDASTKSALMTLGRELDELDALEGEVFQNNKVIKAYRASIVSVINGTDMATAKFGENREAAIKLRRTISALNRATQENIKRYRD